MSMSMIREKAVRNFMKRIRGGLAGAVTDGWLELRKDFSTYLMPCGDLIVFREGVLEHMSDVKRGGGHSSAVPGDSLGQSQSCPFFPLDFEGIIGKWNVSCRVVDDSGEGSLDITTKTRVLESPRDLLEGSFEYSLVLPADCINLSLLCTNGKLSPNVKPAPPLRGVDPKLKACLPLLVPSASAENPESCSINVTAMAICPYLRVLRILYEYCG